MTRPRNPKPRWINVACYPCQLAVATTEAQHAHLLATIGLKAKPPQAAANATCYAHEETNWCRVVVWFRPKARRSLADFIGLCAHESAHVVEYIAEHIGEKAFSSEANAYLLQCVVLLCFTEYRRLSPNTKFDVG